MSKDQFFSVLLLAMLIVLMISSSVFLNVELFHNLYPTQSLNVPVRTIVSEPGCVVQGTTFNGQNIILVSGGCNVIVPH